jgi:hypothetical protein
MSAQSRLVQVGWIGVGFTVALGSGCSHWILAGAVITRNKRCEVICFHNIHNVPASSGIPKLFERKCEM